MMTALIILGVILGIITYIGVAFITFILIEGVTFFVYTIVNRNIPKNESVKAFLFAAFWPIGIPFAGLMLVVDLMWDLFKKGCAWISRL